MSRRTANGILPYQDIKQLIASGAITAPRDRRPADPAGQPRSAPRAQGLSVDQQFLPELSAISSRLDVLDFYQSDLVMYEMDLTEGAILEKGHVYLVPLLERVTLPKNPRTDQSQEHDRTAGRLYPRRDGFQYGLRRNPSRLSRAPLSGNRPSFVRHQGTYRLLAQSDPLRARRRHRQRWVASDAPQREPPALPQPPDEEHLGHVRSVPIAGCFSASI